MGPMKNQGHKEWATGNARIALLLALALLFGAGLLPSARAGTKGSSQSEEPATIRPVLRIALGPLGFHPPSLFYLASRPSELTLNFADPTHLLFTFRIDSLIPRGSNPKAHQDGQIICADLIDLNTRKVVRQAHWTMQDHQRYLWALRDGQFLVREGNVLYQTGRTLQLVPWDSAPEPLMLVEVSPNRQFVAVERAEPADPASLTPTVDLLGDSLDRPARVLIEVYRAASHAALLRILAPRPVDLPLVNDGFVEPAEGKNSHRWLLRRIEVTPAASGQAAPTIDLSTLFTLDSICAPSVLPLSSTVLLAGCAGDGLDHRMIAVNLNGHPLWQQWWQSRYVWHTIAYAEQGNRFALGSLLTNASYVSSSMISAQNLTGQIVGVFDVRSGRLLLARMAQPVVSAGQNFALSANGLRFALLRNHAIEVYSLAATEPPR